MSLEARVREEGLLRPGAPVVVLLSGGPDSVCLLDLAVRVSGAVSALHVDYGLRDSAAEDAAYCDALCARLGVPLAIHRPRRPEGNLQAWARDARYAEAARLAERARRRRRRRPHRVRPGRDRALPARGLARPPRAARHAPARGPARPPAARRLAGRDRGGCAEHGPPVARGPDQREPAFAATAPGAGWCRRCASSTRRRGQRAAHGRAAARRGGGARRRGRRRARRGWRSAALEDLRALPPALARLVVQRLADAAGGPAVSHRTEEILALAEHGALDVGGGLRARIEHGRLQFVATPPRIRAS